MAVAVALLPALYRPSAASIVAAAAFETAGSPDAGRAGVLLSTYIGSPITRDGVSSVRTDRRGNFYLAGLGAPGGISGSVTHQIGPGVDNPWIAKFDRDGTPLFLTFIGGSGRDSIWDLAVDDAENIYAIGSTESSDFPVVASPRPLPPAAAVNNFIVKVRPEGSSLWYSTIFESSSTEPTPVIAVNPEGAVGFATSASHDGNPFLINPLDSSVEGLRDALVGKINAEGTAFEFVTLLGGNPAVNATDIAIDRTGDVYVTGWTALGGDFPLANPVMQIPPSLGTKGFVTKISADGSHLVYSSLLGGERYDSASGIAVDDAGNAYVAGTAQRTFPIDHDLDPGGPDSQFAYVLKLDPSGTRIEYSAALVRGTGTGIRHLAVDAFGNVTVVGETISQRIPLVNPLQNHIGSSGYEDLYIARVSPSGAALRLSTYYGGDLSEFVSRVAINPIGTVYVGGYTTSSNFPLVSPFAGYPGGGVQDVDGFVLVFNPVRPPVVQSIATLERPGKPFRVRFKGTNLQAGARAFIGNDPAPWGSVVATGTKLTMKGEGLVERFPVGTPVTVRILNPDGGGTFATVVR